MKIDSAIMESAADQASDLLKALSNRHRLLIICQLIDGERSVGDLAAFLSLRDSTGEERRALPGYAAWAAAGAMAGGLAILLAILLDQKWPNIGFDSGIILSSGIQRLSGRLSASPLVAAPRGLMRG